MEEFDFFSHESLLIVNNKGILKRLKTPFRALILITIDELRENEIYLVTSVVMNPDEVMMYGVKGHCYFYYWFIIIG